MRAIARRSRNRVRARQDYSDPAHLNICRSPLVFHTRVTSGDEKSLQYLEFLQPIDSKASQEALGISP